MSSPSFDQPGVFSPFLVLGDPTPELSVELAVRARDAGAGALELGIPYGDPAADGSEVTRAASRALAAGVSTRAAFRLLRRIRERVDVPLNLLVYANLVHARGWSEFCTEASEAGAATLLCPDVPLEESAPLRDACSASGLGLVQLVGPHSSPERVRALDAAATGFLYLAAHQGTTGARDRMDPVALERIREVSVLASHPVCAGFGLSRAEHVRAALEAGASLAVVGSALLSIVRRWAEDGGSDESLLHAFGSACSSLSQGVPACSTVREPC